MALIPASQAQHASNWRTYYEDQNILIKVQSQDCHLPSKGTDQKIIYLRFENKTNQIVDISFQRKVWYDGQCTGCNAAEQHYQLSLAPQQVLQGSCDDGPKDKRLAIFQASSDGVTSRQLTNYKLDQLQVSSG